MNEYFHKKKCFICCRGVTKRISMHKIPDKNHILRQTWAMVLDLVPEKVNGVLVCSRHFLLSDFVIFGKFKQISINNYK